MMNLSWQHNSCPNFTENVFIEETKSVLHLHVNITSLYVCVYNKSELGLNVLRASLLSDQVQWKITACKYCSPTTGSDITGKQRQLV